MKMEENGGFRGWVLVEVKKNGDLMVEEGGDATWRGKEEGEAPHSVEK